MSLQASFARTDVDIAPGATAFLELHITNLGDEDESVSVIASGVTAPWVNVQPRTLTLAPGVEQTVEVEVRPPRLPSTSFGPTSLSVRVVPHDHPDETLTAETVMVVSASWERQLTLLQQALRGRRGAVYELVLDNRGNTVASCRLQLVDHSRRIDATFDPPSVGVEPGGSALVKMRLRAKRSLWEREARTIPFRVDAAQSGNATASASGTFAQTPAVPRRAIAAALATLAAVGLLIGAWFAVLRPAIRDAADDAVAEQLGAAPTSVADSSAVTSTSLPNAAPPSNNPQTTTTTVDPAAQPVSFTQSLEASTPPGQTNTQVYTVPMGKVLRVRQLYLQNPRRDLGQARLLRGQSPLFTWSLDDTPNLDLPFVAPGVELVAGDQLILAVSCAGVGDPTLNACVPVLTVLGSLSDA